MREKGYEKLELSDPGAEKAVLSGIVQHGQDAYIDVADIITQSTFTIQENQLLFRCFEIIIADKESIDETSIITTATRIGVEKFIFQKKEDIEYLRAILNFPIKLENVRQYGKRIAKLEIARKARVKLKEAYDKLGNIDGSESIDSILAIPESSIFDLIDEVTREKDDSPTQIADGGQELLQNLIDFPQEMAGLPTPWPCYNTCIGGGLRRGGVNLVASRPKRGKTTLAKEASLHFALTLNVPVLMLDTEMVKNDQYFRSLASLSDVPTEHIETGKFGLTEEHITKVFAAHKKLEAIPYQHIKVAGKPFEEVLSIIRRWIIKEVGYDDSGRTKDCVVVYDYFKLMNEDSLKIMQEYQALGFQISRMSDFCKEYDFACLAFVQLNREEDISQSDRLRWLAHSYARLRDKTNEEVSLDGGPSFGNRKLTIEDTRFGPGLVDNYIHMNLIGETSKIEEIGIKGQTKPKQNKGIVVEMNEDEAPFGDENLQS